jgi:lipopolysaccharide export system permease protein
LPVLIRYILKEYLKVLSICFTGVFIVYFAVHFFEKVRRFARYDPSFDALLSYFLLRIPQIILDIMPIVALMSVVLTLGLLTRNNEIIAMKSGGLSPARIAVPLLVSGLTLSLVLLGLNLSILPALKDRSETVRSIRIQKRPTEATLQQSRIWMRAGPRSFLNVQFADSKQAALFDVDLYDLNEDYSLRVAIEAEKLRYENGGWMLYNGTRRTYLPDGNIRIEHLDRVPLALNELPEEIINAETDTGRMTYGKLAGYVKKLESDGFDAQRYRVDLYAKTSLPFIPFIFTLVGAPMGLRRGIGPGISRGIGLSLIMAAAYFVVYSLCINLGYGQVLPSLISAWLPNALFGLAGVYLLIEVSL